MYERELAGVRNGNGKQFVWKLSPKMVEIESHKLVATLAARLPKYPLAVNGGGSEELCT